MSNRCRGSKLAGLTAPLMWLIVTSNSCKRELDLPICKCIRDWALLNKGTSGLWSVMISKYASKIYNVNFSHACTNANFLWFYSVGFRVRLE